MTSKGCTVYFGNHADLEYLICDQDLRYSVSGHVSVVDYNNILSKTIKPYSTSIKTDQADLAFLFWAIEEMQNGFVSPTMEQSWEKQIHEALVSDTFRLFFYHVHKGTTKQVAIQDMLTCGLGHRTGASTWFEREFKSVSLGITNVS